MITLSDILKGSEYSLTQFSKEKIFQLEERIEEKEGGQCSGQMKSRTSQSL